MSQDEEKIVTVTDDPKFNAIYAERVRKERLLEQNKRIIKISTFFALLVFYTFLFFNMGYSQYFFYPGIDTSTSGNPIMFLVVFILCALFIWLPMDSLDGIGRMKISVDGAGAGSHSSPPEVLRFFGWVIYTLPAVISVIYYFISLT